MGAVNFVICFAAVFVQLAYSCPTNRIGLPIPYQPNACRYNLPNPIIESPCCRGRFPIESLGSFTSSAPLSLSIRSENSYQGLLDVRGRLPFTGTVGLNGVLPSVGEGVVSYGCGDGLAIAEVPVAAAYGPGAGVYGPGAAVYGPGVAGCGRKGCSCAY